MHRRLTPSEHLDRLTAEDLPNAFAVTVRVRGGCTEAELQAALAAARSRHPLMSARVVGGREVGNASLSTRDAPAPPLRVADGGSPDAWQDVAADELQRPFSLSRGPLVRFVLLRGADRFDLVMVTHHLIADGMSFLYLARDILQQLTEPSAPVTELAAPSCWELLRRAAAGPRDPVTTPARTGRPAYRGRPAVAVGSFRISAWSLDEARTDGLIERCRAERTTVYAALSTAFLRALVEVDPGTPIRCVGSPFSLRALLPPGQEGAFGCYVGPPAMVVVDTDRPVDFWDAARLFKAELTRQTMPERVRLGARILRAVSLLPSPLARWLLSRRLSTDCDLWISNLGRLPVPDRYGSRRVEAVHLAVNTGPAHRRVLGVAEVGGRIHLTLACAEASLMAVRARAEEHLARAVAPGGLPQPGGFGRVA